MIINVMNREGDIVLDEELDVFDDVVVVLCDGMDD